jgi:hypothetical protein
LRGSEATEAISCINSFEIATPRQVGARNDKGMPQNLVTHHISELTYQARRNTMHMISPKPQENTD